MYYEFSVNSSSVGRYLISFDNYSKEQRSYTVGVTASSMGFSLEDAKGTTVIEPNVSITPNPDAPIGTTPVDPVEVVFVKPIVKAGLLIATTFIVIIVSS